MHLIENVTARGPSVFNSADIGGSSVLNSIDVIDEVRITMCH